MSWVAVGVAAVGTVGSLIASNKAKKDINNSMRKMPMYVANPEVKKELGLAQTLYNSDMPGIRLAEQNIFKSAANTQSNINRSATDVNQALLGSGQIHGQTNQALTDLSQKNIEDEQRRLANLNAAQQAQVEEENKVFQSKMGNFQNTVQLMGMKNQINQQSWNNLTNFGIAGAGAINSWYGKGGGGNKSGNGTNP